MNVAGRSAPPEITVTTFRWVPGFAKGNVRDLRVRWALEEAGLAYRTRTIGFEDQATAAYRAQQPFGQVPVYQEDELTLFESGAIVLHLGAGCEALLPAEPAARARAVTWAFAALNTVEIPVMQLAELDIFHEGEDWAELRRPGLLEATARRLDELAAWLGARPYLEERFSAGDLLMTTVLRALDHTDLVRRHPVLGPYVTRCEARPAFERALRDHLAVFEEAEPELSDAQGSAAAR